MRSQTSFKTSHGGGGVATPLTLRLDPALYVSWKRHKIIHAHNVMWPWQQFCFQISFIWEWHSPILDSTSSIHVHSLLVYEETRSAQQRDWLRHRVTNGSSWFKAERYWNQNCCHGNITTWTILYLSAQYWCQVSSAVTYPFFPEIFLTSVWASVICLHAAIPTGNLAPRTFSLF